MKACVKCGVTKATHEYQFQKNYGTYRSSCKECSKVAQKIRNARWYAANKEKAVKRAAEWAKANPDKAKVIRAKNYQNNKEGKAQYAAQWYAVNKDRQLARKAEWRKENQANVVAYNAEWKRRNAHLVRSYSMKRIAQKLQATPKWANEFFIEEAYDLAVLRTQKLGIKYHVDHVVPLKSPLVCGLHWEGNMQVIPAKMNISKSNRYWPDMPEGRPHG